MAINQHAENGSEFIRWKNQKLLDLSFCCWTEDCFVGNCQYVAFVGELQPSNNSSEDCNFKQFVFSFQRWIELCFSQTTPSLEWVYGWYLILHICFSWCKNISNQIYWKQHLPSPLWRLKDTSRKILMTIGWGSASELQDEMVDPWKTDCEASQRRAPLSQRRATATNNRLPFFLFVLFFISFHNRIESCSQEVPKSFSLFPLNLRKLKERQGRGDEVDSVHLLQDYVAVYCKRALVRRKWVHLRLSYFP